MLLNTAVAFAGPSQTTYQARIVKPDGYALEASNVNFQFTILDPSGSCIIYSETYSAVNMGSSGGLVSFSLGTGVRTFPVSGSTFEQVFSNTTASLACNAGGPGTYSPSATDTRKIVMQFNDGSGWQTLPAMTINAVPYAMYANDALTLRGRNVTDFVQVASLPSCGVSEAVRFNGVGFSCIAVGSGSGSVTSGSVITALGYTPADGASITAVTSSVHAVSSTVASLSGSVSSLQSSVAASFAALTNSQWISSGTSVFYANYVGIGTADPITTLDVSGGVRISMESATCSVSYAGTIRYNSGNMQFCNGSGWLTFDTGSVTSAAVISALGYAPVDAGSVSSAVNTLSTAVATSLTNVTNNLTSVTNTITSVSNSVTTLASSLTALSGAVSAVKSSQWSDATGGGTAATTAVATSFSPLGQLGTQNTTPTTGSVDDGFYVFNLPFAVNFNGTNYSTIYIGTNSYATFGGGSTVYSSLSAVNPALNKIVIDAADRSSNSVWFFSDASSFSIRYEGGCTTAPATTLVWELQGSITDTSKLKLQIISVCGTGVSGVATPTTLLAALTATPGNAYSIEPGLTSSSGGIFYASGNVGIGTSAPTHALHLGSSATTGIAIDAATNSNSYLEFQEAGTKKATIYLKGSDDTLQINDVGSTNTIINNGSGNVGIGTSTPFAKLDVSGGVRIGMDTVNCAVSYAGTLRYNAGTMQFCNGSTWLSVNTGTVTSAAVVAALGYTPADVANVSSTVTSLSTAVATSFTTVTNNIASVSSSVSFLSSTVGAIKSSQWSDLASGSFLTTTLTAAAYSPLGQLGTQNTTPTGGSVDDGYYTFTLPFAVSFNGASYTTVHIGTNSYVTFGGATTVYSSLSAANPPLNKIMINSADRSSNSVWYYSDASSFSIRYEGGCTTAPSNAMVWELQGTSANPSQLKLQIISVCSGGFSTLANTTTQLQALSPSANSAYLIDYAVSNDGIFYSGNVGIGTSAPMVRLDVAHGVSSTYGLRLKSTTSATVGGLYVENDTGDNALIQVGRSSASATLAGHMLLQTSNKDVIFNSSANTERMRILSTGNVGVGVTTPVTKLDVSGGVRIGMESAACAAGYAGTLRYNSGSVDFCNGTSWVTFSSGAVTSSTVAAALGSSTFVGIGTSSPTQALHVSGTVRITGGTPGAGKVLTSDASGNATWQTVTGDNLGNHTATQNINLGTHKLVGNGGSEGIAIDSSGNVRLGFIGGNAGLTMGPATSTVSSSWGSIAVGFDAQASSISTFAFGSGVQASDWYAFATGNDNIAAGKASAVFGQYMTVDSDYSIGFGLSSSVSYTVNTPSTMAIMGGKVGIGNTAPPAMLTVDDSAGSVTSPFIASTDKLAVIGSGNTVIQVTSPASNTAAIYFSDPQSRDPGGVAYSHLTDSMGFRVSGATRMTIASGGAVGIGTGTPVTNLQIRGGANYGAIMLGENGGTTNHHLTHESDGSFGIFTGTFGSGVRQLIIDSAGRMGIGLGNNSPSATLHVSGTARFTDGNQAAGRVLASDASGNAAWKQTIITKTGSPVGNSSTVANQRVSAGYTLTLPPGKWKIDGMGITTQASCRANFGIRTTADTVIKYTIFPPPNGDWQTTSVMAFVDIGSTTSYELFISSRDNCTSQIHTDPLLWEFVATGVAY